MPHKPPTPMSQISRMSLPVDTATHNVVWEGQRFESVRGWVPRLAQERSGPVPLISKEGEISLQA